MHARDSVTFRMLVVQDDDPILLQQKAQGDSQALDITLPAAAPRAEMPNRGRQILNGLCTVQPKNKELGAVCHGSTSRSCNASSWPSPRSHLEPVKPIADALTDFERPRLPSDGKHGVARPVVRGICFSQRY